MSKGKQTPTGSERAYQQSDNPRSGRYHPAHTPPPPAALPFDAPTIRHPHNTSQTPHSGAAPFDAPTMLHPSTGQHSSDALGQFDADIITPPAQARPNPFDAPTIRHIKHTTGILPSYQSPAPPSISPFDAPTMMQPKHTTNPPRLSPSGQYSPPQLSPSGQYSPPQQAPHTHDWHQSNNWQGTEPAQPLPETHDFNGHGSLHDVELELPQEDDPSLQYQGYSVPDTNGQLSNQYQHNHSQDGHPQHQAPAQSHHQPQQYLPSQSFHSSAQYAPHNPQQPWQPHHPEAEANYTEQYGGAANAYDNPPQPAQYGYHNDAYATPSHHPHNDQEAGAAPSVYPTPAQTNHPQGHHHASQAHTDQDGAGLLYQEAQQTSWNDQQGWHNQPSAHQQEPHSEAYDPSQPTPHTQAPYASYHQDRHSHSGHAAPGYTQQAHDPNAYAQSGYHQDAYGGEQAYHQEAQPQDAYAQEIHQQSGYYQDAHENNNSNAYDPNAYDPNAYDPNAYDPNAYSQDMYAQEGHHQNEYAQDAYAQGAYSQEAYLQEVHGQDAYGQDAYGQDAYAQDAYAQGAYSQGSLAHSQEVYAQEEDNLPEYTPQDMNGHHEYAQDASAGVYAQDAYAQDAYAQDAYAQDAYAQDAYAQDAYGQDAYGQDVSAGVYAEDAYAEDAYAQDMSVQDAPAQGYSASSEHGFAYQGDGAVLLPKEVDPWAAYHAAQASQSIEVQAGWQPAEQAGWQPAAQSAAQAQVPDAYNPYAQAAPAMGASHQVQPNWRSAAPAAEDVALDVIVGQSMELALEAPPRASTSYASHEALARPPRMDTPPDRSSEAAPNLAARLREALGDEEASGPSTNPAAAWRSGAVFQEGSVALDPVEAMVLEQKIEQELSELLATVPPEAPTLAQLFWQHMAQALKKITLYQHQQDRNVASYFASPMAALLAYHRRHQDLTMTVQPFDFMLGEASVHTVTSQENSPTYKLYGAGIRTLTFAQDMPFAELVAFGQCLALTPQALQEEDIASRLWRADLRKITTLQVQSIEIADEGAENIQELTQLVAMLAAQLHTDDPQQAVNFRGIDALDLLAGTALMNAETARYFGELPALPAHNESTLWHKIRAVEEASLATYGCQLYSCLFKHIDSHMGSGHRAPKVADIFGPHLQPLCDHLFLAKDFHHIAILLDAIDWQSSQPHNIGNDQWRLLLSQLSNRMSSPENVSLLLAHLREVPRLSSEQEDALGVYLHFLGTDVQRALIDALPTLAARVRRLLLEVMSTAPRARGLLQTALVQLQEHDQVLLDLLNVASSHANTLPRGSLRLLLRHKNQLIQIKAFLLLAKENPEEAKQVAESMLTQSSAEARSSIVDILCQHDEDGVFLVLAFAHSEGFDKLSPEEQVALYSQLGTTREPAVIDDCIEALRHKSQLLKPQIDRRKRLAIAALKASQTPDARKQLERALREEHHSKKMLAEMTDALKTMWT